MSAIPPLNVKVNIDASGVATGVNKATAGLEQISDRSKKVSSAFGSLRTTILGVFGGNLLTNAVFAVGRELNAMKQEAIDLQTASTRLNGALAGVGVTSEKLQKDVFTSADAYYQLGFQGSEAVNAMGTLVTATGSVSQANKLLAISADLARYKHIDMNTAATVLARGTQGSARAFKELGITLDTTLPKNKAIEKAFDELNKKIGGQAQAYTKTFAGQMAILKEKFDNFAQAIGAVVIPIITRFISIISGIANYVSKNSAALQVFLGLTLAVTAALKGTAIVMAIIQGINPFTYIVLGAVAAAAIFVKLWNTFDWFRKGMSTGLAVLVAAFGYLIGIIAKLIRVLSFIPGFGFLKNVAKDADAAAKSVGNLADKVEGLGKKKITTPKLPKITGAVTPGQPTGIKGGLGTAGDKTPGGGGGGSQTVQYVTVYASNTNDIAKNLAKAAKNGTPIGSK